MINYYQSIHFSRWETVRASSPSAPGRAARGSRLQALVVAQTTSSLGNALQAVALAWLILDWTGSGVALGGALMVTAVAGMLTTVLGGVVADRFDPRYVMACSDAARAALVGLLCVLAATGDGSLTLLYVVLGAFGAAGGIFVPAATSLVPRVVGPELLHSANSLTQASPQVGSVIGAPLAGVLIAAIGTPAAFLLNAVSFVFSSFLVLRMTRIEIDRESRGITALTRSAGEGLAFVLKQRWLVSLLMVDAVLGLAAIGPMSVGLPLLARSNPSFGATGLGVLLFGYGAGALLGMILVGVLAVSRRPGRQFCLLSIPQGLLLLCITTSPLVVAAGALCLLGILGGYSVVVYLALIQSNVPRHLMGRVMSLVGLFSFGLVPLSQALTGVAATALGVTWLFIGAGGVMVGAAVAGMCITPLRTATIAPTRPTSEASSAP